MAVKNECVPFAFTFARRQNLFPIVKDAYYFSHDSNARNDQKILAVRMKYGIKGYGIYFGIIEMLRESKSYELLNDWSTIAFDLREDQSIIEDIIKNFGLFILNEKCFYSDSLKRRMIELDEKRIKRSIAGRIGGLASSSKRQAIVNDRSTIKVNKSKVNESKEKDIKEVPKIKYLEFVFLKTEEYNKLIETLGQGRADNYIERLNNYLGSTGKKYKSHYHTILNWSSKEGIKNDGESRYVKFDG